MRAPPTDPALVEAAVAICREAGELTLQHFRTDGLVVDRKGDGTPVTEADRGAERLVRQRIAERFPGDGVLGEEEDEVAGDTGRRWIVDPIDGTKAFTHGVPLYTNLLAVEDEHGLAVGVINVPALGETVWAGRGRGAFCDGRPARVSARDRLPGSYLSSSGFDHWDDERLLAVKRAGLQLRTWGDGYGYVLVATGRIDVMVDPIVEVYDVAPMPVILAEAGGRFSSFDGRPGPDGGSGVASNGHLHDEVLALLR